MNGVKTYNLANLSKQNPLSSYQITYFEYTLYRVGEEIFILHIV